jgi:hypothetical protein
MRIRAALVFVFCVWMLMPGSRAGAQEKGISPQDLLPRYRQGVQPLIDAYKQVQIEVIYSVTNLPTKRQRINRLLLMQDGPNYKVIDTDESGPDKSNQDIRVASPERSFVLRRDPQGISVKKVSRLNEEYDTYQQNVTDVSAVVRAPYSYFEMPIADYLSKKEATIESVKEEVVSGQPLLRVRFHVLPWTEQLRQEGLKQTEGWFLFDPQAHWALYGFEIKDIMQDSQPPFGQRESLEYGQPANGIPVLKRVKMEKFNKDGVFDLAEGDVKSVRFGPTDAEEFTLKGSGFLGEPGNMPRSWQWLLSGALVVSLVVLLCVGFWIMRRKHSKTKRRPA